LPSTESESLLYAVDGGVLSLSGPGLRVLLRTVVSRGVAFRFTARGLSMQPFIRDGDVITVAPLTRRSRRGDVLAVCDPVSERLVVHRVVAVAGEVYVTRGDNTDREDGPAHLADVVGRVVAVERAGRRVRLGHGPEGALIAAAQRHGWLAPAVRRAVGLSRLVKGWTQ
jgi:hypothetical protein